MRWSAARWADDAARWIADLGTSRVLVVGGTGLYLRALTDPMEVPGQWPEVRAVLEAAGVKDILSKSLGSANDANVAKATLAALQSLRLRDDILRARGLAAAK